MASNMAFQNNFWSVNMLIGQYDYELERILQASSKIKKQFSNLLEREIKRMIEQDDKTENYQTRVTIIEIMRHGCSGSKNW